MENEPHLLILRQAAARTLPSDVDSESPISVEAVRELVGSGYLEGIDVSSFDGPAFADLRITVPGREYLRVLEERARAASLTGKVGKHFSPVLKWIFGIVAAVAVAFVTKQLVG